MTNQNARTLAAVAVLATGCALLLAAFLFPPPGEIHDSVLVAFGESITFAGALLGINFTVKKPPK